jgi:hypothetical protein
MIVDQALQASCDRLEWWRKLVCADALLLLLHDLFARRFDRHGKPDLGLLL